MARQPRTTEEITQVNSDENRFFLPIASSLDVGEFTVYGTTDPVVDLSMVNIRHLNNTRSFRGPWVPTPTDGEAPDSVPAPYLENQVVIGPDNHLYRRNDMDPTTNPNPMTDDNAHWVLLSAGLDAAVTELTSNPSVDAQNLYAAGSASFTVSPNANATLNNPSQVLTSNTDVSGTPTFTAIDAAGDFTVNFAAQTNPNARISVTTAAESSTTAGGETITHEGGQVDSTIVFQDGRTGNEPTVLRDTVEDGEQRISLLPSSETASWNVNLLPNGSTLAAGTAYDVGWRTLIGTTRDAVRTATGPFNLTPLPLVNTNVVFEFPLNTSTIQQVGAPADITRSVRVYIPWYWQFSNDAIPTTLPANPALRMGEMQPDEFSMSDFQATITGTANVIGHLYFFVDASITRSITLNTGIANAVSTRLPAANNITVMNRDNSAMVTYALHRFRIGLVNSSTNFNIRSA